MAVAKQILKYVNLFVDGRGYAGTLQEYSSPDLTVATEDFRAGGMDAPIDIDMGLEKLNFSFILTGYDADVLALLGIKQSALLPLTARGALEDLDGTVTPVVHKMTGRLNQVQRSAWTSGSLPPLTINGSCTYFQEQIGGRVINEIDVPNMVRIIDGVDVLAEHRAAIGL